MKTMPWKILFCWIMLLYSLGSLSAGGIMDLFGKKEPEKQPTINELFKEMPENIPAVALIKPEIGNGVDPNEVKAIIENLVTVFIQQSLYRPYSVTEWLEKEYSKRDENVITVVKRLFYEKFALKTVITTSFRKINGQTLLRLGFYHLDDPFNPVYFIRFFKDIDSWKAQLPVLLQEMSLRVSNPVQPFKTASVYVKDFPAKLFLYSELNSGEFEFTDISILKVGTQDFRKNEDLIKDLLTYELHSGQIVGVVADDLKPYHLSDGKAPCEYTIDGELRISEKIQLLIFNIYSNDASGKVSKIFEYEVPVNQIGITPIQQSLRYVTKLIYNHILLANNLGNVSFNDFDLSAYGQVLYFNNFYIGNPVQTDFCLPVGCHWFSLLTYDDKGNYISGKINESNTAIFVSPLDKDGKLYDRTTARFIQALTTVGRKK